MTTQFQRDNAAPHWFDRLTERIQGSGAEVATPRRDGYFARPLAPSPLPALLGVVVVAVVLLVGVAEQINNDYLASTACFLVLLFGAVILDVSGRRRAERDPNPLYKPDGLPSESPRVKALLVLTTLSAVVTYGLATAKPGEWGSPLPYFFAAAFLFLVMPQILARRYFRVQSAGPSVTRRPDNVDDLRFRR